MTSIESVLVDPTSTVPHRPRLSAALSMIGSRRGTKHARPAMAPGGPLPMINNSINLSTDAVRKLRGGADTDAPVVDTTDRVFTESLDSPPPGTGG